MEIACHGWGVVVSKPAAEFAAQDALRRRGYVVCLPVYRKVLRSKRKSVPEIVFRPLFQSYLFAELHPGQGWVGILHTPGVSGMVRRTGERDLPALLEPELIEVIREEAEAGIFDDAWSSSFPAVKPGQRVRVAAGRFSTFIATLREVDERGRAQSLVTLFNREVPAAFQLTPLASVSA